MNAPQIAQVTFMKVIVGLRVVELCEGVKEILSKLPKKGLIFAEILFALLETHPELLVYFFVKVFQELLSGRLHLFADLDVKVLLQLVERRLNFILGPTLLIDVCNPLFEIDTRFYASQYFVTCAEYAAEELKFLRQQLINAEIGSITSVEEINDYDILRLPVSVAASNPLLNPLRVPWHVVIHDKGAELEVDALRRGFGSDHDFCFILKALHNGGAKVRCTGARDTISALVFLQPPFIDLAGLRIGVCAVEEDYLSSVLCSLKYLAKVLLGPPRFREYYRLAFASFWLCLCEPFREGDS